MNRRGFLKWLGVAPAVAIPKISTPDQGFIPIPDRSLLPEEEHQFWAKGIVPPRHSDDNDLKHFVAHLRAVKAQSDELPSAVKELVEAHINNHRAIVRVRQEAQEQHLKDAVDQFEARWWNVGGGVGTGSRRDLLD